MLIQGVKKTKKDTGKQQETAYVPVQALKAVKNGSGLSLLRVGLCLNNGRRKGF